MLFDEQTTRVKQCTQQIDPGPPCEGRRMYQSSTSHEKDGQNSSSSERPRDECIMPQYDNSSIAPKKLYSERSEHFEDAPGPLRKSASVKSSLASAYATPAPLMVQHIQGQHRPWQLVFATSDSSSEKHNCSASQLDSDSGALQTLDLNHAGVSQYSHVPLRGSGAGDLLEEAAVAAEIVDEEPWKSFLAIPGVESSHSIKWARDESSVLHPHSTTPYNAYDAGGVPDVWSHHATPSAPTTFIPSDNSAILPSKRQISKVYAPTCPRKAGCCRQKDQSGTTFQRSTDVGEESWRDFVFGSNQGESSKESYRGNDGSEMNGEKGSSGYLPLSVAVSSIRSPPMRSASGLASCLDDGAQNATRFGFSWPRGLSSPVALSASSFKDMREGEEGDEWAKLSATGNELAGFTSLHDITFCATRLYFSGGNHNTGMSRGDTVECTSKHAHASSSASQRGVANLSINDISDSDSGGLDMIDPESML